MATCTHRIGTGSTSNVTSYASASFTPAAGDLLVAFVGATGTVAAGATMTDSQGLGFTRIPAAQGIKNGSADSFWMFVSNNFAAASAMTVTFDCTGDAATGAIIEVFSISGMSKTGALAVLQSVPVNNKASATTPAATFGSSVQTGNPTAGFVFNGGAGNIVTQPTGWTEQDDSVSYTTPAGSAEYVTRDSGFTGTTITWGSTSASNYGVIIAEFDASASSIGIDDDFWQVNSQKPFDPAITIWQ